MFSGEFCEIFKNTFFTENLRASDNLEMHVKKLYLFPKVKRAAAKSFLVSKPIQNLSFIKGVSNIFTREAGNLFKTCAMKKYNQKPIKNLKNLSR